MGVMKKYTVDDQTEVLPLAASAVRAAGMEGRIRLVPGDYYADELPGGADLAWVSAIVHQNSRAQNRALFQKVFAALIPGGTVLIRDVVMDGSRITPVMGAFFAVNMLVATPHGGTFTFDELQDDLASAGFADIRLRSKGQVMDSIIEAIRAVPPPIIEPKLLIPTDTDGGAM